LEIQWFEGGRLLVFVRSDRQFRAWDEIEVVIEREALEDYKTLETLLESPTKLRVSSKPS
jgi:hypothetical protein